MKMTLTHRLRAFACGALAAVLIGGTPQAQAPAASAARAEKAASAKAPTHAQGVKRLLITDAMVIPGTGVPAYGPVNLLVEDGLIARIGTDRRQWPAADA